MMDEGGFVDMDRALALRLDTHCCVATNAFARLPIHPISVVVSIVHFTFTLKVEG